MSQNTTNKKSNYNKSSNNHRNSNQNSNYTKQSINSNSKNTSDFDPICESNAYTYSTLYFGSTNLFDIFGIDQIREVVKDPIGNNEVLRKISLMLYGTNGTYTNTVDYMTAMPTLDKVIVPHGNNSKKKRFNKELMASTLRTIKDKEIMRDALFRGMLEGVAFYYFETTERSGSRKKYMSDYDVDRIIEINESEYGSSVELNDLGINASIISLPVDYTRIVGIKNSSYVLAFDLDYFTDAQGETQEEKLKKYPKEIRDAFVNRNNNGNWVILDNNKTIAHKIRSKRDEKYGRPLVLAAINDILYNDYFVDTKRNVLDDLNNRVVYQTFPQGKNDAVSSLTKKQQKDQHEAVKGAVLNKNERKKTSFFSVAAGTKINTLDTVNTDILDEKYEANIDSKIALGLGINGGLLNGTNSGTYGSQSTNLELLTAELLQWIEQIEAELNKCISANIIKDTKNYVTVKYLPITHVNKKNMISYAKDLYTQGCGSLSFWISTCGIDPETYFALLDSEIENGIYDKYHPHATSYNSSGNQSESAGRPITEEPTDSTLQSRESRENTGKHDTPGNI